jgi:uncharacterized heparinase superfamily protein
MASGRFSFLNQEVDLGQELGRRGWHDAELSQLWRYHLHYFGYVADLLWWAQSGERQRAFETFKKLAAGWIESNHFFGGDGWHPYTLSLRIVNWLHALRGFDAELQQDEALRRRLIGSLYTQCRALAGDLETDVRGNHLLENLRALIWAGVAFEGAEAQRWLARALSLLKAEVYEQVLPDGGHFERSPGYHLVVLKDLLEIGLWLQRNRREVPGWLREAVERMSKYLLAILPPDQQVPLLKDTAWDAAPQPHDVLAAAALWLQEPSWKRQSTLGLYPCQLFGAPGLRLWEEWALETAGRSSMFFPHSGHAVAREDASGEFLIFDVGKPCPDYLPAHAHADLLTYELCVGGQRVVVDSGVYEYANGPWRAFFRSTRAHNTVEIAGENQSEVWSSFRVARRARPLDVFWHDAGDYVLMRGAHDGYTRLANPVVHRRTIVWCRHRFWLIADEILPQDSNGRVTNAVHNANAVHNWVHLHPSLSWEPVDRDMWRIVGNVLEPALWFSTFGVERSQIVEGVLEPVRQGWYAENFGERQANAVLDLQPETTVAGSKYFGYVIAQESPATVRIDEARGEVQVEHGGREYSLSLPLAGTPQFSELCAVESRV